eukprot:TRINITY_DN1623_c0_g1_i2.p1 TRINITY_DN1623_c0_g1~~TRINITY_DN1623_c0_g1_i2.p1  ORF type:complete len:275 (+),score=71.17 TRINITY_DN1623_c0_g1_i2:78-902(+)
MFRSVCLTAAACLAFVGVEGAQIHKYQAQSMAGYKLRVCNAYSTAEALQVFVGAKDTNNPVKFQACADYDADLSSGVRIGFKNDGMNVGAFAVNEVPFSAGRLLLVVHNAEAESDDIAFKSHIFGSSYDAQVAMIDLSQKGAPFILTDGKESDNLKTDNVVELGEGAWQVTQKGTPKGLAGKMGYEFKAGQDYVVMRTGPGLKDVTVFPRVEVPFKGAGSTHKTGGAKTDSGSGKGEKKEGYPMWMILGFCFLLLLLILLIIFLVMKGGSSAAA